MGDLVELGLVTNLARPGGNFTGFVASAPQTAPKRVQILSEILPQGRRTAVLWNPASSNAQFPVAPPVAPRGGLRGPGCPGPPPRFYNRWGGNIFSQKSRGDRPGAVQCGFAQNSTVDGGGLLASWPHRPIGLSLIIGQ